MHNNWLLFQLKRKLNSSQLADDEKEEEEEKDDDDDDESPFFRTQLTNHSIFFLHTLSTQKSKFILQERAVNCPIACTRE